MLLVSRYLPVSGKSSFLFCRIKVKCNGIVLEEDGVIRDSGLSWGPVLN